MGFDLLDIGGLVVEHPDEGEGFMGGAFQIDISVCF